MAERRGEAVEQHKLVMRVPDVVAFVGVSRVTIHRWTKAGTFPSPVKLGTRLIGWRRDEVEAWLESRPATMAEGYAAQS